MVVPHTTAFDWSNLHPAEGRLARSLRMTPEGCRVALLGLPDDTGIALNGGRVGARHGPQAFREALARYGCSHDAVSGNDLGQLGVFDAGDVEPAGDEIHRTHIRVSEAVDAILQQGMLPVCIGGGHDLTFPGAAALARRLRDRRETLGGLNIDTHLDVRERVGSGMAFRRIIEEGAGVVEPRLYATVGVGAFSNDLRHLDWLRQRGAELLLFDGDQHELLERFNALLERLGGAANLFASFDLDVLDASVAPGVSALNPMGLTPVTASIMCRSLGRLSNLRYFDLMELSPPHDVQGRTARLAVHLLLHFLAGVAERL